MKRLARILSDTVTAASLILCLASLALWIWGASRLAQRHWQPSGYHVWLECGCGGWALGVADQHPPPPLPPGLSEPELQFCPAPNFVRVPLDPTEEKFAIPGLRYESGLSQSGSLIIGGRAVPALLATSDYYAQVIVSWWAVPFLTILAPAAWVVGRLLRRRPNVGLCTGCGYDLRATPDRCPECGMMPREQSRRHAAPARSL